METPTDEALLRDFLAGHVGSFELIVRRHSQELHQFVLRFTRSAVATEDVLQETFLQLYASADRFDFKRRFKPWLFTIAANKARDHLRSRKRKREVPMESKLSRDEDEGQNLISLLEIETPPPDEELGIEERRRRVKNVIDEMPDHLREILVLAYFHRFPYRDVADMLDIPLGTVKSRLHAAVTHFGEKYRAKVENSANLGGD